MFGELLMHEFAVGASSLTHRHQSTAGQNAVFLNSYKGVVCCVCLQITGIIASGNKTGELSVIGIRV